LEPKGGKWACRRSRHDALQRLDGPAREAAAVAFFLALAAFVTRPLVADLSGSMFPGPDPLIFLWTVHWLASHILAPAQLFGGNIFHPFPYPVLHSDIPLGTVVLIAPLRVFVAEPVLLHNAAVLAALAFGGWAFHALVRALTGNRAAGLLAGVLAAFGSHQLTHFSHLPLLSIGWLAVFLLGLFRLRDRPAGWAVLLAGGGFALVVLSSGYYAVAAALVGLVFAVANAAALRKGARLGAVLGAVLLALLLTAPYRRALLALRAEEGMARAPEDSVRMAFRPDRDLTSRSYLYRGALGAQGGRLFPGLVSLVLGGFALVRRRRESGFFGAAALVLLLVSLGPRLHLPGADPALPYAWLFGVPPLDSMRHPVTFAAVATFLLAVLAGLGWAEVALAKRPWAGQAVVALAILETLGPAPVVKPVPPGVPPVYEILSRLPKGPILDLPVLDEDTLLWAARHGMVVANGQGAFTPARTAALDRQVRRHWLDQAPEDVDTSKPALSMQGFGVRYVIVPQGRRRGLRTLARAFDRSQSFAFVAEAPDGDRIYEVRRGTRTTPGRSP
jgi:hypothetical protein